MSDQNTLTLSKPIMAHGQNTTTLTFREVTGADIAACGVPFSVSSSGDAEIKGDAMGRMISALAAIPPSSVAQMGGADWVAAAAHVIGFFGVATREKP